MNRFLAPFGKGVGSLSAFHDLDDFVTSFDKVIGDIEKSLSKENLNLVKANYGEDEQGFFIQLELPGFKKEDIDIELEDNNLSISSKLTDYSSNFYDTKTSYFKTGFHKQKYFKKTFKINSEVVEENISAKMEDGILTVLIPKLKKNSKEKEKLKIGIL